MVRTLPVRARSLDPRSFNETTTYLTVRVPLAIRAPPGRKTVVTPIGEIAAAQPISRADPALVKALGRAFRYQRLLDEERYRSISEMAESEGIERGCPDTLLRLTLLAPDIVEAVLNGRQRESLGCRGCSSPSRPTGASSRRCSAIHP